VGAFAVLEMHSNDVELVLFVFRILSCQKRKLELPTALILFNYNWNNKPQFIFRQRDILDAVKYINSIKSIEILPITIRIFRKFQIGSGFGDFPNFEIIIEQWKYECFRQFNMDRVKNKINAHLLDCFSQITYLLKTKRHHISVLNQYFKRFFELAYNFKFNLGDLEFLLNQKIEFIIILANTKTPQIDKMILFRSILGDLKNSGKDKEYFKIAREFISDLWLQYLNEKLYLGKYCRLNFKLDKRLTAYSHLFFKTASLDENDFDYI
jgi:hypothetical protein